MALRDRVRTLPPRWRVELEPLVEEAIEAARFQKQALALASAALRRLRDGEPEDGPGAPDATADPPSGAEVREKIVRISDR